MTAGPIPPSAKVLLRAIFARMCDCCPKAVAFDHYAEALRLGGFPVDVLDIADLWDEWVADEEMREGGICSVLALAMEAKP